MPSERERNRKLNTEVKRQLKHRTRLQQNAREEIRRILRGALTRIENRLSGTPSDFDALFYSQIQNSIRNILGSAGNDLSTTASNLTSQAWGLGINLIDKPIEAGGINLSVLIPNIDDRQLYAMRTFVTDKIKDITTFAANRINTELGLALIGAQPVNTAIGNIKRYLQKPSRAQAQKILRTQLLQTYSIAAQQRSEQAAKLLPGLRKKWLPSGRTHAREHHEAARGQIQSIDNKFSLISPNGPIYLKHPRDPTAHVSEIIHCGCESVPHMDSWNIRQPA